MRPEIKKWYDCAAWQHRRAYQLKTQPLCLTCAQQGKIEPATAVDHIEPHRGDYNRFVLGELQSLCFDCHNRVKQQVENAGYSRDIGEDGFPTDERHPFHARK